MSWEELPPTPRRLKVKYNVIGKESLIMHFELCHSISNHYRKHIVRIILACVEREGVLSLFHSAKSFYVAFMGPGTPLLPGTCVFPPFAPTPSNKDLDHLLGPRSPQVLRSVPLN